MWNGSGPKPRTMKVPLHRLAGSGGLVHRGVAFAATPVHLERRWTEATDDEVAVAVGGAIEITLRGHPHVVAGDHDPVRVGMVIETHVVRLGEGGFHGIGSARAIGGVPIGHRGPGRDLQLSRRSGELCVSEGTSRLLFAGVDLARPSLHRDPPGDGA